jgi:hypothetical protein
MSYGMEVRLSSGLTNVDDVYTVRPKEEHEIDAGAGTITLNTNQFHEYGTFTTLGIDYDDATDAYFVVNASTTRDANFVKRNFWDELVNNGIFAINGIAITFVLDTSDDKAKVFFWVDSNSQLTLTASSGHVLLPVDIAIVKIKAS